MSTVSSTLLKKKQIIINYLTHNLSIASHTTTKSRDLSLPGEQLFCAKIIRHNSRCHCQPTAFYCGSRLTAASLGGYAHVQVGSQIYRFSGAARTYANTHTHKHTHTYAHATHTHSHAHVIY